MAETLKNKFIKVLTNFVFTILKIIKFKRIFKFCIILYNTDNYTPDEHVFEEGLSSWHLAIYNAIFHYTKKENILPDQNLTQLKMIFDVYEREGICKDKEFLERLGYAVDLQLSRLENKQNQSNESNT